MLALAVTVLRRAHGSSASRSAGGTVATVCVPLLLRQGRSSVLCSLQRIRRHNYLFCGSDEGARRHAIISTVLGNCALSGVEPGAYLRDVLTKLAGDWPQARLHELLPRAWAAAQQQPQHAEAQQLLAS